MNLIGVIENLADISFQEWGHHQGEMLNAHRGGLGEVEGVSLGSLLRKFAYRGGLMGERGVSSVPFLKEMLPGAVFALPLRENAHRGG